MRAPGDLLTERFQNRAAAEADDGSAADRV